MHILRHLLQAVASGVQNGDPNAKSLSITRSSGRSCNSYTILKGIRGGLCHARRMERDEMYWLGVCTYIMCDTIESPVDFRKADSKTR